MCVKMVGSILSHFTGTLQILLLFCLFTIGSTGNFKTKSYRDVGKETTTNNQQRMYDFGFEIVSVMENETRTNDTEITVQLQAPDDTFFYSFHGSMRHFVPATEHGPLLRVDKHGDTFQAKIKAHPNFQTLVGISNFTYFVLNLITGGENEVSLPRQNCRYSDTNFREADYTWNTEIKLHCDSNMKSLSYDAYQDSSVFMMKKSGSVEITSLIQDRSDFTESRTVQSDGSVLLSSSFSKQKFEQLYAWADHGVRFVASYDSILQAFDFGVFADEDIKGNYPILPPGRTGFQQNGYLELSEGEESYIQCFAFGNPAPDLSFAKKPNDNLSMKPMDRVHKTVLGYSFGWTKLASASLADAGEYSCMATSNGEISTTNVTVRVRPKAYVFDIKDPVIEKKGDGTVNVTFQAIGYSDINVMCYDSNYQPIMDGSKGANVNVKTLDKGRNNVELTYTIRLDASKKVKTANYMMCYFDDSFSTGSKTIDLS